MGYYKDSTVEVTLKGEKVRISKVDKKNWDALKSKKAKAKK